MADKFDKPLLPSIAFIFADLHIHRWVGGVAGWLDRLKIKLISVPARLKLELITELGNKKWLVWLWVGPKMLYNMTGLYFVVTLFSKASDPNYSAGGILPPS